MFSLTTDGGSQPLPDQAYGAITGKDGRFSIGNMKAANYIVSSQKAGYIQVPWNSASGRGSTLSLKPGEHRTDVTFELTLKAVIRGRVTDEHGDPVRRAQISGVPVSSTAPQLPGSRGFYGNTDERGQFRVSGAPGRYYVSATPQPSPQSFSGMEVRTDGSHAPVYATTWFPAVADKSAASAVDAVSGRETTGIDIRLASQRSLSIRGIVTGVPPGPARPFLTLWPEKPATPFFGNRSALAEPDGKFTFAGVAPGAYYLAARLENPAGVSLRSPVTSVRVDSSDRDGLELHLIAGEELHGVVEGVSAPALPAKKRTISFEPAGSSQQNRMMGPSGEPATLESDGSFRIANLFPGKYRVTISSLPDGFYVKTVRADSVESRDGTVDLTRGVGGTRVKVAVFAGAASVEGAILTADGRPSEAPIVFAFLGSSADEMNLGDMKQLSGAARYSFRNIRPGKYRLFVFDAMQFTGEDTLKPLFEKAEPFEIREGDKITRDLKLPGKPAANEPVKDAPHVP